ncbi:MAG: glycerol-3-phosphate 1-O-acyltransferase PlsY [Cyanobacteria bacterium J06614_10]
MSASTIAILLLGLLGAYLLGSIPTGFVLGKALKGIDIREHGSGNTGATNVFRVMGKGAGMTALVIDLLKGVMAVFFMHWLLSMVFANILAADPTVQQVLQREGSLLIYGSNVVGAPGNELSAPLSAYFRLESWFLMLAALMAVLGHSKSVWLGFTGGKSAATGLGVLLALAWPVGLSVAAVFATALAVSRTVSVGSIAAALSVGIFMVVMHQPLPYLLLAIAGGLYVVLRHKSNIARLLEGTEPKTFGG